MYRGLLRYYAMITVTLVSLIIAADYWYRHYYQAPESNQLPIAVTINLVKEYCLQLSCDTRASLPFKQVTLIDKQNLALPIASQNKLANGQSVSVVTAHNQLFYYAELSPYLIVEIGPITLGEETVLNPYTLGFYGFLCIAFLAILWPLFSDMWRIKEVTSRFAKSRDMSDLNLPTSYYFKPVTDTIAWMLNKIARLLALQN